MRKYLFLLPLLAILASCSSHKLVVSNVTYQSVRATKPLAKSINTIPKEAKIAVVYYLDSIGNVSVAVKNLTDNIMIVDNTKSHFISNGNSTPYYDPTVKTTSTTDFTSGSKGVGVNLGSVAGAFGIGGVAGQLLNGVNVSGGKTRGESTTNTTQTFDLPQTTIGPRGTESLQKTFVASGIGNAISSGKVVNANEKTSPATFSVSISYSFDEGQSFDRIITDFYVNSQFIEVVNNKDVNSALRNILQGKSDALTEYWWDLNFVNNISNFENIKNKNTSHYSSENRIFIDYQ